MFTGIVEHVGVIESLERSETGARIWVNAGPLAAGLAKSGSVAMKGSIALDGISLTVAGWHDTIVETAIIPFTYAHTNLSSLQMGDAVNIECDILAKYVEQLMETRQETAVQRLNVARLVEEGF